MDERRWSWWRRALALVLLSALGTAIHSRELIAAALTFNPVPATAESLERGARQWTLTCAPCHGPQAHGDGPLADSLPRRPKDLSRMAAPPVLPDGIIAYRIANGRNGMPAWKSVIGPDETWDLVNFIRAQKRP